MPLDNNDAACRKWREENPGRGNIWFVPDGLRDEARAVIEAEAISICNTCPIEQECLDWAIQEDEQHGGIWGGHNEKDLRRLVRAKKRREREARKAAKRAAEDEDAA